MRKLGDLLIAFQKKKNKKIKAGKLSGIYS